MCKSKPGSNRQVLLLKTGVQHIFPWENIPSVALTRVRVQIYHWFKQVVQTDPINQFSYFLDALRKFKRFVFIRLSCLWFFFPLHNLYNRLYLFKYNFSNNSRNIFDIHSIVYKYALKLCSFLVSGYTYLGSVLVVEPSVASGPKKR